MNSKNHFTEDELAEIKASIAEAEKSSSGEIRLYIEDICPGNMLDRAAYIFQKLKMDKTRERNGVLIYIALESRQFAVIGDAGIHAKVGDEFWYAIRLEMEHYFGAGQIVQGLKNGILSCGKALCTYFPYHANDRNELPDDIVFGNSSPSQKED